MLIPYNSYKLYDPKLKYKQIVTKGHINQDLARYELHRVWVIEANVKPGFAHRYKKRVFYLDEDSWIVHAEDIYDERAQFWRTARSDERSVGKECVSMCRYRWSRVNTLKILYKYHNTK